MNEDIVIGLLQKNNKSSFQKVIENIDRLQRDYLEYFDEKVSFNAVIHNRNSVKDIYEFIYNRYHKIPSIAQLNRGNINPNKKDLFEKIFKDKRKSEDEYQKIKPELLSITYKELNSHKELSQFLNHFSINLYIANLPDLLYDQASYFPTGTCFPFQRKMYLNTYHNLLPCEKVSYTYSMGKTDDEVVIDIPEIVQKYNFYYKHIKKICQRCYTSKKCNVCLFSFENLDKLGTEDFICPGFEDKERFKNKLYRIFSFLEKTR